MNSVDQIITTAFELSRIFRHTMVQIAKEDRAVNFLQLHALALISKHEGMTRKELADALMVTSPSATVFINRLVKLRWIVRLPDAKNRKLVRLKVTPMGKKIFQQKSMKRRVALRGIFSHLAKRDQQDLARILGNLKDALAQQNET
ncbi:MarR family transcriptional regulator [Candidatus Peregrinibacteria bacterium]|nr:MarR family transcriptional regulator [Candidatus Peregrinibacteria bacterium]MBI3816886.1 MarR family transcriptional regulator [Candidatus Peregrinibacteria bacterium]